jgi:hypothetical protein
VRDFFRTCMVFSDIPRYATYHPKSEDREMAEPLAYRPKEVRPEGGFPIGRTKLYGLLASGEIESFTVGRARFIPRQALIDYMQRSLDEQAKAG